MKRGQLITTDQFKIMKKLVIKPKLVNRGRTFGSGTKRVG